MILVVDLGPALLLICAACRSGFDEIRDVPDAGPTPIQVQRGTAVMTTTQTSMNVPIQAVQPEHAFLLFDVTGPTVSPSDGSVSGSLSAGSLSFTRTTAPFAMTISWQVIELPTLVDVQRGSFTRPNSTDVVGIVPITSADPSRTFVTASHRHVGVAYDEDDYVRARQATDVSLELHTGTVVGKGGSLPNETAYQIITLRDGSVDHGEMSFAPGTPELSAAVDIDALHAFAVVGWYTDADDGDVGSVALRGEVTTAGIRVVRGHADLPAEAAWSLVTLPAATVQHGFASVPASSLAQVQPIDGVDPARSFVVLEGGSTPYAAIDPNDRAGIAWFRGDLSATTLTLTREDGTDAADVSYAVVTF